jgi:hypothetical protein
MRTYVQHRNAPRDEKKLASWDEYISGVDTTFRPPVAHTVIDNSVNGEIMSKQARDLIGAVTKRKQGSK